MPDVLGRLADGEVEHLRRSLRGATIRADEETRRIRFVCSTEEVARDGHVIRADGWKLENFNANAVFLWCHKTDEPPVGKFVNIGVEEVDGKRALVGEVEFADAQTYPFADTVFRLYQGGFLNAVSVQWEPISWHAREDESGKQVGIVFTESELLETSAVPVPADPKALMVATQRGLVSPDDVDRLVALGGRQAGDALLNLESEVLEMSEEQNETVEVEDSEERGVVLDALDATEEAVESGDSEAIAESFGELKNAIEALTSAVTTVAEMVEVYADDEEMDEDEPAEESADEVEAQGYKDDDEDDMRAGKKVSADRARRIGAAREAAQQIVELLGDVLAEDQRSREPGDDEAEVPVAAAEREYQAEVDDYAESVLGDLLSLRGSLTK